VGVVAEELRELMVLIDLEVGEEGE